MTDLPHRYTTPTGHLAELVIGQQEILAELRRLTELYQRALAHRPCEGLCGPQTHATGCGDVQTKGGA